MLLALVKHVVGFLSAADTGGGHAHGGGKIGGAEAHGLEAGAGGGDFLHMSDAGSGFDDDLELHGLGAALGAFHGGGERVHGIDVGSVADLGNHDPVDPLGRLFEDIDHVAVPVWRVEPVYSHRQRLATPVDVADGLDDVGACDRLVVGRNRILEIEVDDVRGAGRHLLEDRGARARAEKLAAVRAGGGRGLDAEAHVCAFR